MCGRAAEGGDVAGGGMNFAPDSDDAAIGVLNASDEAGPLGRAKGGAVATASLTVS